jgi:hypothetical protein
MADFAAAEALKDADWPLTSFDLGAACLFRRLTLEPAR